MLLASWICDSAMHFMNERRWLQLFRKIGVVHPDLPSQTSPLKLLRYITQLMYIIYTNNVIHPFVSV